MNIIIGEEVMICVNKHVVTHLPIMVQVLQILLRIETLIVDHQILRRTTHGEPKIVCEHLCLNSHGRIKGEKSQSDDKGMV